MDPSNSNRTSSSITAAGGPFGTGNNQTLTDYAITLTEHHQPGTKHDSTSTKLPNHNIQLEHNSRGGATVTTQYSNSCPISSSSRLDPWNNSCNLNRYSTLTNQHPSTNIHRNWHHNIQAYKFYYHSQQAGTTGQTASLTSGLKTADKD